MKMLVIFLSIALLSFSALAEAPSLIGGVNFTMPTVDSSSGADYEEEGQIGGVLGIRSNIDTGSASFLMNFGVEVSYRSIDYNSGNKLEILKIELPVYFGYNFNQTWAVFGGPRVAFTADLSCDGCTALATSDGNERFTLPLVVGGRMMFSEKLGGELYYEYAFFPVARLNAPREKFFDSAVGFNVIYKL